MTSNAAQRLQYLTEIIPAKLLAISERDLSRKPAPGKWSKKEIVGHLIDSAANNHHRFIRTQYEDVPVIFYDQNKWNELNRYQETDGGQVIELWTTYNRHLVNVITGIPDEALARECNSGDPENKTLGWLIDDYVVHLEHHLKQIVDY